MSRKVIIVAGSNRTGTSLLAEILVGKGFEIPDAERVDGIQYEVYESAKFKTVSRNWNDAAALDFVKSLPQTGSILLKYPKASLVIGRWLKLIPDARVIYVYRNREEAVASNLKYSWGTKPFKFLARWYYRREWNKGILALADVNVPIDFVTFEDLKSSGDYTFPSTFGFAEIQKPD